MLTDDLSQKNWDFMLRHGFVEWAENENYYPTGGFMATSEQALHTFGLDDLQLLHLTE
jgi:hypothetical protein